MAGSLRVADPCLIHVPQPARLESDAVRQALADAGVAGWLCLMVADDEGERRILGFDAFTAGRLTDPTELGFARRALDVLVDAVARDALEREHARLAARLQQAQRMETIGVFASGIAHNFNNLIGAILGYCEMAGDAVAADSRIARHIQQIQTVGDRARELVGQILAYGRPYTAAREPVHIDRLIADAASLLRASLPETVILVLPERINPVVVRGVPIQLQQVVLNLCTNAAQAMAEKGRIEILVDHQELETPRDFDHGTLSPGPHVRIVVGDSGPGMGSDIIARIFEPFFTTRRAGNGLGLATVKEIVREHSGALAVASRPGNGSRFEVWLPEADGTAVGATLNAKVERLRTILLIDDDQARLERDEEILAAIGYEPVGFGRPGDALAACLKTPGRYDAVILGQTAAPTAELTAFASQLNAAAPHLPILLATIKADDIEASVLTRAGVREVVRRPLNPADVALALERCLDTAMIGS